MDHRSLPRWRGFNLLEKFVVNRHGPFVEADLDLVAEWGLDFVRIPADYRCWTTAPGEYVEASLADIDQVIAWGRERGIHVNLCLHRAPGYCVNPPAEPLDLWADGAEGDEARRQFAAQWAMLAERYAGIPAEELSFNLVNEPADVMPAAHERAMRAAVEAIRGIDTGRLVIADGRRWGTVPAPELAPLNVAQSTRGYAPMQVSHYRARWVAGSDAWQAPTWPLNDPATGVWDRARLLAEQVEPWKALQEQGVGVHVGEFGAHNQTPHGAVLAWVSDLLTLWRQAGWGWSLWNLRGSFGVMDSGRADVDYEDFRGHKLDRRLLELLLSDR